VKGVGRSGVVVNALDFRSGGRWLEAQSLPSCCFLREELCPSLSQSPPRCISGYWRHTAGANPVIDNHPIQGGVAILSVASCYRNQDKLWPFGPPWLVCNFAYSEWFAIIRWGGYLSNGCCVMDITALFQHLNRSRKLRKQKPNSKH